MTDQESGTVVVGANGLITAVEPFPGLRPSDPSIEWEIVIPFEGFMASHRNWSSHTRGLDRAAIRR
jgi:hypothetical protein